MEVRKIMELHGTVMKAKNARCE